MVAVKVCGPSLRSLLDRLDCANALLSKAIGKGDFGPGEILTPLTRGPERVTIPARPLTSSVLHPQISPDATLFGYDIATTA